LSSLLIGQVRGQQLTINILANTDNYGYDYDYGFCFWLNFGYGYVFDFGNGRGFGFGRDYWSMALWL
jgi:hypothetical protein